ncbi:MAG: energy transducer TonB [Methylococcales bacterium]|nr:energy transducer TonB [Methylococcales bacterium]
MKRPSLALLFGIFISLGLFWLMQAMIINNQQPMKTSKSLQMTEFIKLKKLEEKVEKKPKPPEKLLAPPPPPPPEPQKPLEQQVMPDMEIPMLAMAEPEPLTNADVKLFEAKKEIIKPKPAVEAKPIPKPKQTPRLKKKIPKLKKKTPKLKKIPKIKLKNKTKQKVKLKKKIKNRSEKINKKKISKKKKSNKKSSKNKSSKKKSNKKLKKSSKNKSSKKKSSKKSKKSSKNKSSKKKSKKSSKKKKTKKKAKKKSRKNTRADLLAELRAIQASTKKVKRMKKSAKKKARKKSKATQARSKSSSGVKGGNSSAKVLSRARPKYPRRAMRSGKEGWVKVSFMVTPSGSISGASVVGSSSSVFNSAALSAVRRFRVKPKKVNGRAVSQRMTQTIRFKLP